MRLGIVIFTGLVAFAPTLVSFIIQREALTWQVMLTWAAPAAIWGSGWVREMGRTLIFPAAIAVFLALIVLLPVPDGFTWPRLAGVALALAVTAAAVSGVAATAVWSAAAVTLLAVDFTRASPHGGHLSTSPLDAISTFLGLLVVPPAIAVISRRWTRSCREWDNATEATRQREARSLAAESAAAARATVDRRIHETVLNTLATISRMQGSAGAARSQCAADVESLDLIDNSAPRKVQELVTSLIKTHRVPGIVQPVVSFEIQFLDDEAAQVAYSAVGEVLRNISRHAQATRTVLRVRASGERVTFTIMDNGRGMDEYTRLRFGMRRALSESVASIGGSVAVESAPARGTTVTIEVPLSSPQANAQETRPSAAEIVLGPRSVRLAMASPLVSGLILLIPTAWVFGQPVAIAISYLLFAAAVVAVVVRWHMKRLGILAWSAATLLVATQVIAWAGVQGCASAGGLHQVLFATAGAMVLPALAQRRLLPALVIVLVTILPTLVVPLALPAGCRVEASVPAIETSLWVATLVGIITLLARAFDRSNALLQARWRAIAAADARKLARSAADQRWRSVDDRTRTLLYDIADGRTSPENPGVRRTAAQLETRLRSLLETSRLDHDPLRECVEEAIEGITAAGATVAVVVVEEGSSWTPPMWVGEVLAAIGRHAAPAGVHLTILADELLVTAPRSALLAAGLTDLGDAESEQMAVASIRTDACTETD